MDNREFVQMKGRFPSSDPRSGQGGVAYDSDEEERDLYQQDLYMNAGRNRHGGRSNRPGCDTTTAQPHTNPHQYMVRSV